MYFGADKEDAGQTVLTKADHETRKSDDLLKRDFSAGKPLSCNIHNINNVIDK